MSFLYRSSTIALRSARPSARLFSTTVTYRKTPVDSVKDGLKAVDRTVSDAAVAGIDKGVEMKDKATEATGMNTGKPAAELAGEAKGKAHEVAGEAKGKAAEVKGEAKAKMS